MPRMLLTTPVPLTLLLTAALALSGSVPQRAQAQAVAYAYNGQGATIAVRPLDDPGNPYRGQYGELERWLVEHAETYAQWKARSDAAYAAAEASRKNSTEPIIIDMHSVEVYVLPEGWVVPADLPRPGFNNQLEDPPGTPEQELNRWRGNRGNPSGQPEFFYLVAPEAALPADIAAERMENLERKRLEGVPPIPAWLGARPPLKTVFVPNGDIAVYGELDLHYAPNPDPWALPEQAPYGEKWYIYTAEGQLQGMLADSTAHGMEWVKYYWPNMHQQVRAVNRGPNQITNWGGFWFGLTDPVAVKPYDPADTAPPEVTVYAAFDYRGNPLPLDQPVPAELRSLHRTFDQSTLAELYALQLKYGLTSPDSLSPYEGQPGGPVAVDPAPRPRPVVAQGTGETRGAVRVKGFDDPANPYRGQYTDWDRWVWERNGARDPHAKRMYLPGESFEPVNFFDSWREIWLSVGADGVLPPLSVEGRAAAMARLRWDRRDPAARPHVAGPYQFYAGGELDEAQWAQLKAYHLRDALEFYPRIPDWLLAQPVASAVFLPNGDVGTRGPLGSYNDGPERVKNYEDRFLAGTGAPQYVYSADGMLKATLTEPIWEQHYWSAALKAEAAGWAPERLEVADGYTLVYAGPRYTKDEEGNYSRVEPQPQLLAVYDWDGTTVDISQPVTRPDFHGVMLQWEDIRAIAAAQRLVSQ